MLPTCKPSLWWGLWNTRDNCWLGNADGPFTFDRFQMAQAAAQVAEDMMTGSDLAGRISWKVFTAGSYRLKDEVPIKHTAEESLRRIEGGEYSDPLDPTTHVL